MTDKADFPSLCYSFFSKWLERNREASPHTQASYRTTIRLLLRFAMRELNRPPAQLSIPLLDADLILKFLDHLELERKNSARSRNARLAAIKSFYKHVALEAPEHLAICERVGLIPAKRYTRREIDYLTSDEIQAILQSFDQTNWVGRRNYTFTYLAMQTGMRLAELTGLRRKDLVFGPDPFLRCHGKGRKERIIPLTRESIRILKQWLRGEPDLPDRPVFPNSEGERLSHDAIQYAVRRHYRLSLEPCPSLKQKHVTPHVFRHTAAMEMLQAGNDEALIALVLGHESLDSTKIYISADLALKRKVLEKTGPMGAKLSPVRADDALLRFLAAN